MNSEIKLFSGESSRYLAEKIAKIYGTPLGKSSLYKFSDGEYQPGYD
jgi:ribose-phosphate pyrophosphokinase